MATDAAVQTFRVRLRACAEALTTLNADPFAAHESLQALADCPKPDQMAPFQELLVAVIQLPGILVLPEDAENEHQKLLESFGQDLADCLTWCHDLHWEKVSTTTVRERAKRVWEPFNRLFGRRCVDILRAVPTRPLPEADKHIRRLREALKGIDYGESLRYPESAKCCGGIEEALREFVRSFADLEGDLESDATAAEERRKGLVNDLWTVHVNPLKFARLNHLLAQCAAIPCNATSGKADGEENKSNELSLNNAIEEELGRFFRNDVEHAVARRRSWDGDSVTQVTGAWNEFVGAFLQSIYNRRKDGRRMVVISRAFFQKRIRNAVEKAVFGLDGHDSDDEMLEEDDTEDVASRKQRQDQSVPIDRSPVRVSGAPRDIVELFQDREWGNCDRVKRAISAVCEALGDPVGNSYPPKEALLRLNALLFLPYLRKEIWFSAFGRKNPNNLKLYWVERIVEALVDLEPLPKPLQTLKDHYQQAVINLVAKKGCYGAVVDLLGRFSYLFCSRRARQVAMAMPTPACSALHRLWAHHTKDGINPLFSGEYFAALWKKKVPNRVRVYGDEDPPTGLVWKHRESHSEVQ